MFLQADSENADQTGWSSIIYSILFSALEYMKAKSSKPDLKLL